MEQTDGNGDALTSQLGQLQGRVISPVFPAAMRTSQQPIALLDSETKSGLSSAPQVPRKIGAYYVDGMIGSGGMGSLYRVTHEDLGRNFALKLLWSRPDRQESVLKRFRREWHLHGQDLPGAPL